MNRLLTVLSLLIMSSLACALPFTSATEPAPQSISAPSGSILFQDDFSSPTSGFDRFIADQGIMDYDAGGYRILVNALQTNFWATPRKTFSDVRIEVDTGKLGGPDENRVGLLCRFSDNNYYFFLITSDGFYGVGVYFSGQAVLLGQSEMKTDANIHKGLAVNHLRADCAGNTLSFFVNGFQVTSVKDDTLTSGDVGILAGTFDKPGVDIIFDNFIVVAP